MLYPLFFLSTLTAPFTVLIWTVKCVYVRVRACVHARRLTTVCFLMLCNCHVDILRALACISHLCRSGCFVCFDYYGRPPVVISHFGGTFKNALAAASRSAAQQRLVSVSGAVVLSFCQTLVL